MNGNLKAIADRAGMELPQAQEAARWILEASEKGEPLLTASALSATMDNIPKHRAEACSRLLLAILETIREGENR